MEENMLIEAQSLWERETGDFYRNLWGSRPSSWESIPSFTLHELTASSFASRGYERGPGVVKIVSGRERAFLVLSTYRHLAAEPYEPAGQRPFIFLQSVHEAIEQGLRMYGKGSVPLLGNIENLPLARFTAQRYGIDSVTADAKTIEVFVREIGLPTQSLLLEFLIRSGRDVETYLSHHSAYKDSRAYLVLPETGLLARGCMNEGAVIFHGARNATLSIYDGTLLVTKTQNLSFPLIKYKTSHAAESRMCERCGTGGFALR